MRLGILKKLSNPQKTKRFLNILFYSGAWQKTMKFYPLNEVDDADINPFMQNYVIYKTLSYIYSSQHPCVIIS